MLYFINLTELIPFTLQDGIVSLHQIFADHSHNGSVRKVAVGGRMLASGAADEMIRVFNLKNRTEVGIIMEHQGK